MKDLKEVFQFNTIINELIAKATYDIAPGILKLVKDAHQYIDTSKNLVVGSESYIARQKQVADKNTALEMLQAMNYTCTALTGELDCIYEHCIDQDRDYGDEGSYTYTTTFYTRKYSKTEILNPSTLLLPYTDEVLEQAIRSIEYSQSDIFAYQMCERLDIKMKDLKCIFHTSNLSHWSKGMCSFTHFVKYNGKEYTDEEVLKLLADYKVASGEQYVKDDEIVEYPRYTPYVDFLEKPYILHEDPDRYAMAE